MRCLDLGEPARDQIERLIPAGFAKVASPSRISGLVRRSGAVDVIPGELALDASGDAIGRAVARARSLGCAGPWSRRRSCSPRRNRCKLFLFLLDALFAHGGFDLGDARGWRRKPVSGSMPLTTSIMPSEPACGRPVKNPAWPSIDFSMSALQGQTVTQWPQETQLDSPIVRAAIPQHAGMSDLPVDG